MRSSWIQKSSRPRYTLEACKLGLKSKQILAGDIFLGWMHLYDIPLCSLILFSLFLYFHVYLLLALYNLLDRFKVEKHQFRPSLFTISSSKVASVFTHWSPLKPKIIWLYFFFTMCKVISYKKLVCLAMLSTIYMFNTYQYSTRLQQYIQGGEQYGDLLTKSNVL